MATLTRLISGLTALSRLLARASSVLVAIAAAVMMTCLVLQVFSRYVLGATFIWTEELALLLFTWIVLVSATIAIHEDSHVRLTLAVDSLPGPLARIWRRVIWAAILAFCLVLLWSGHVYVEATVGRLSAAVRYPLGWLYWAAPVAGALGAIHALARLVAPVPGRTS